ncbi:TIGR04104 family putative zinc finger protein [Bacillus sp. CGMCC 1.16541]|uniref:TIGR04104 family putative zinc finger protein n=1 Tax=Bacillus sp. CGMCC 1.16541 TaxID=2185143 RepID=UPI000D72FF4E|nr:TIGR04104 family putative zinc finger protein [Bacillus sp. CGMCC 1.16541]
MPTCQHCQTKWTWTQTFKKSFTLTQKMTCPYCEKAQYLTKDSRVKNSILSFIPPVILLLTTSFGLPLKVAFSLLIGAAGCMFILYPFMVKLSNNEEPLW